MSVNTVINEDFITSVIKLRIRTGRRKKFFVSPYIKNSIGSSEKLSFVYKMYFLHLHKTL